MLKNYSIKEVSEQTGLSRSNIRYYEKEGLIPTVNRDKNSIRQYAEKDISWIDFLSKLKNMEITSLNLFQKKDILGIIPS